MISLTAVYLGGILTILLALFHSQFYKLFKWEDAYEKIGYPNNKIFHTIHIALPLIFLMIGMLSVVYTHELSQCNGLSLGFCLWRGLWQIKGRLSA